MHNNLQLKFSITASEPLQFPITIKLGFSDGDIQSSYTIDEFLDESSIRPRVCQFQISTMTIPKLLDHVKTPLLN